jgi:hypothetical protein
VFTLIIPTPTEAKAPRDHVIDLAIRRGESPEIVRGPVTLKLRNINLVRYEATIGQTVTLADGPDLSLPGFIPAIAKAVPKATPAVTPAARDAAKTTMTTSFGGPTSECPPRSGELSARLDGIQTCLGLSATTAMVLLEQADEVRDRLNARSKSVNQLVADSGQKLMAAGGAELLTDAVGTELDSLGNDLISTDPSWPSADEVKKVQQAVESLRKALDDLPFATLDEGSVSWSEWIKVSANYIRYRELQQDVRQVAEKIGQLAEGSDLSKAHKAVRADLVAWKRVLTGLDQGTPFEMSIPVPCGYPFFQQKTVEYTLTLVDRTIADKSKNKTVEKIANVVCPSNVTVTGGVGASGIDERDFGFVPSLPDPADPNAPMEGMDPGNEAPALVTRIGLDNESSRQVNPTVLISTRLGTFRRLGDEGAYSWHLTAGSVFDFDSPDSNVAIGYVLGLSFSFKDSTFITLGTQASRVSELAGGFKLGDQQPMGLDKVPLTKEWSFDWFVGLTYRLGGSK